MPGQEEEKKLGKTNFAHMESDVTKEVTLVLARPASRDAGQAKAGESGFYQGEVKDRDTLCMSDSTLQFGKLRLEGLTCPHSLQFKSTSIRPS